MSVVNSNTIDNPTSTTNPIQTPQQLAEQLEHLAVKLRAGIPIAAKQGDSFDQVERSIRETLRQMGSKVMQLFVSLQGDGDLGPQVTTEQGTVLLRSQKKSTTFIRSIFGRS